MSSLEQSVGEAFSEREFRNALGEFPTGVAVVSAVAPGGGLLGMTVSSFNSVSLDPPLVMFSVARRALSFAAWHAVDRFAVNLLAESQEELSNRFARSKGVKWTGLSAVATRLGLPVLTHSLVTFLCETYSRCDGGDHELILGRVIELHWGKPSSRQPLVVARSNYRRLATQFADAEAVSLHDWC